MLLEEFDYELPSRLIAQKPAERRGDSRLMVLDRNRERITHTTFSHLPEYVNPGEIMVVNESRVIPARLSGRKKTTGAAIEILLVRPVDGSRRIYKALAKPMKRLSPGTCISFAPECEGNILERDGEYCIIQFFIENNMTGFLEKYGETPLPPYITQRNSDDRERYQTTYARVPGSVAAPTAGLHFSESMLKKLADRGVVLEKVILHVGPGTFMPLRGNEVENQHLEEEEYVMPESTAQTINRVRGSGNPLIAVGTTTTRLLESCADKNGIVSSGHGFTSMYIYPGYGFKVVEKLITNFHLPRSSLLLLVSAFAGRDFIMRAYKIAVAMNYRFYSYGDAMIIL